eukprot:1256264-Prymnesium_polylepis.1
MPVYFQKINCVKEITRAIVRKKQLTLLLPDAEVHGEFTRAMIRDLVTDEWLQKWKLQKKLAEWSADWGLGKAMEPPTPSEICDALFEHPPLEWSRITPFQDRTLVVMCQRMLPEAKRDIYMQGSTRFKLPKRHLKVKVHCSPHNLGARELVEELNKIWPGLLEVAAVESWSDLSACDHMLVYLNALTWTRDPEPLAAEIREAQRMGLHLQLCHEFPSVLDPGSLRHALEFKQIMDATPADLAAGQSNIYSQIAIALKGGELRNTGLANLAARLVVQNGVEGVVASALASASARTSASERASRASHAFRAFRAFRASRASRASRGSRASRASVGKRLHSFANATGESLAAIEAMRRQEIASRTGYNDAAVGSLQSRGSSCDLPDKSRGTLQDAVSYTHLTLPTICSV